jgi:hypothetical protein
LRGRSWRAYHWQINTSVSNDKNNLKERQNMSKSLLFIAFLYVCSFSQTSIPNPTGHPNCAFGSIVNIGDFDGDSSDDLFCQFNDVPATMSNYYFGIYSMKKNQFLLIEPGTYDLTKPVAIGDFDGDKLIELVIGSKIYKYNSTLTKKKI